ncbi:MAG TPA: phosphoglycerate kinase [Candidatus Paceibacterota bacterium]|nr:phosphoglycerate kinase [Candidatus Paceibacterota bacterium]
MKGVADIPHLENVPVLVRASLNAEASDGRVTEAFRLKSAVPTIRFLKERGARVILIGHVSGTDTSSLLPMYEAMAAWFPGMKFCPVPVGEEARRMARELLPGEVLMLENLRRDKREERNDPAFAAELAELADVFVQDSFDVLHRKHASVVGIPELLPSYAGLQVMLETKELGSALYPKRPALAIIGGAKFGTKEPVLSALLDRYDRVFVGGALANDFMQAKGNSVGSSLVSGADPLAVQKLMAHGGIALPKDYIVAPKGSTRAEGRLAAIDDVRDGEAILDNGPKTLAFLADLAAHARTVLWNGPLGNYENGFIEATEALAVALAKTDAHTIVGGGDTVAAIEKLKLDHRISFISTGGGAMLDFLAYGTLPGLDALR